MDKLKGLIIGLILAGMLLSAQAFAAATATPRKPVLQSLNEPQTPAIHRSLSIKGYKTLSGTKILFIRTPGLPMFDVLVSFAAGSAHTPHQPGLAAVTFSLLNEGVTGKDVNAIQATFDDLGARMGMDIDQDRTHFSLRSLSDESRRTPALELFAQVLGKPLLPQESLPAVKSQLQYFLDLEHQSHAAQARQANHGQLFPDHGYAQSLYGTRAGLASITRAQAQDFHREAYAAGNAQITMVGDLTEEDAQRIGSQISAALPPGPTATAIQPVTNPTAPSLLRVERPSTQAYLRLAQPSVLRSSPDYVALQMAMRVFTNRLTNELRERRGLTYHVEADLSVQQAQGLLTINLQTRPEQADAVLAHIKTMFSDFLAQGPTQQELEDSQQQLAGSAPLNSATNGQILKQLHAIGAHNLPLDLDFATQAALKLNLASIKTVLNRHYHADQWHVVILGPKTDQQSLPAPSESATNTMCRVPGEIVAS
ncbi:MULTISPECIES: pitrilysin family protein [unclassified Pseudomonas]|uniref:M16 family metallopeptidase n=1 Tax=unclassified Pseudomonas TaxID=196821 RepID=UPI000C88CF4F|nr:MULTISPECIES: pitrilysin family protein [unclassified Pseudomonas]PMZ90682.1 insulinase family protein [Pseudomonas sp. FW215-T2]PNA12073.1 insulinase family protein [Pseudomonas sp. FW215-R3]PNB37895.1 insulinase family protein [Pseudomonas sp. FW305-131]